jgi:hypothetical protein
MTDRNQLKDRARDELFSHINRCGVLQAAHEDQEHWLDETMEYLGERFPDLGDTALVELRTVGLRFCRPAISNGRDDIENAPVEVDGEIEVEGEVEAEPVTAVAEDGSAG